jgi:glycosyltransferase involved in cell wall biosynthesis
MNIAIVTRGLPSSSSPMLGIFELDQGEALRNIGHNIVFISLDFRFSNIRRRHGFYKSTYKTFNVFNVSFPLGNLDYYFFEFFAKAVVYFSAKFYLNYFNKPDILHSHFLNISNLAVILKKELDIPLVVTEHSSSLNKKLLPNNLKRIGKKVYSNADLIIAVSNTLQKRIYEHFSFKSSVLPNILNTSDFPILQGNKEGIWKDKFTFVSVGTLNYNKGFDLLIDAFTKAKFTKDVQLVIIGEGELKQNLYEKIKSNNVQDSVHLLGYQSRSQIFEHFLNSDIFVLASRGETFGVVFIEALYAGLPVIGTKCGGPEEIISSLNGSIISVNDLDALVNELISMRNNVSNFNRKKIQNDTISKYSSQVIGSRLSVLYESVLKKNLIRE